MKALVIGATGSTGSYLVDALLKSSDYAEVHVFVRRTTGKQNPKLVEHIVDFCKIHYWRDLIRGDVLFSCLGTTLKMAGSKENQWKIDFGIPAEFAEYALKNGVVSLVLLSSFNADSASKVFYAKMKGHLEEWTARLGFMQFVIFKPGFLDREGTDRRGEIIMVRLLKILNSLGILKSHRPIPTKLLAQKLAAAPKKLPQGTSIITLDEIFDF